MLADLIETSSWTHEQWLAASILAFIVLAILVTAYRIYTLTQMARKDKYKPNFRRLRRRDPHD